MTTSCYACSAPSVDFDHVPPRSFFPKYGMQRQLLSVPSCAEHNQNQSGVDEYLKNILVGTASIPNSAVRASSVRGVARLAGLMESQIPRYGLSKDSTGKVVVDPSPFVDWDLMVAGIEKIARGIYFHHHSYQRKLLGRLSVAPHFLGVDPAAEPELKQAIEAQLSETEKKLATQPVFGDYPDIFKYQILEDVEMTVISMTFFGDRIAMVFQ